MEGGIGKLFEYKDFQSPVLSLVPRSVTGRQTSSAASASNITRVLSELHSRL